MVILIDATEVILKAKAFALSLFQRDAHNGLRRGCIAGSGILDDVHMLYLVGTQPGEFAVVLHPPTIDIHLGIAATQHLYAAIALCLQRRNLRQGIVHRSSLLQDGACNGGAHGVALHECFRQLALHHHFAQHLGILFHRNSQVVGGLDEQRLIAHAGKFQQSVAGIGDDVECTLFVADGALHECRVGQ